MSAFGEIVDEASIHHGIFLLVNIMIPDLRMTHREYLLALREVLSTPCPRPSGSAMMLWTL